MQRISLAALLVAGALTLVPPASTFGQAPAPQYQAHPSTQSPERLVTLDKLAQWEKELSNWGRWGKEEQRGTLNLITPEKTRQAASLVREGITIRPQQIPFRQSGMDTGTRGETVHRMTVINADGTISGALDYIGFSIHDGLNSHLDALCHYRKTVPDGKHYGFNGHLQLLTAAGCGNLGVDKMGPGYVTRGVLVDMPLMKGVKWLEPSTPIYIEDLEAWEKFAGITIGPGDALLVRTGRWAKRAAEGPWAYGAGGAGLHASVLPWLRARDVALLVGDAINDVQPSGVQGIGRPIHQLALVNLGLPLVDNAQLEELAETASRLRRWEFMFTLHLFGVPGGTASPFNALATF